MSSEPPQGGDPAAGSGGSPDPQYRPGQGADPYGQGAPGAPGGQPYDTGYGREYGGYTGREYGAQPYPGQAYPGYPPPAGYPQAGGPPTGTSPDPLVPFSFGDWISKIIGTVRRSGRPLLVIQLLAVVPLLLLALLGGLLGAGREPTAAPQDPGTLLPFASLGLVLGLLAVAVSVFGQAVSVFVIVRDAADRPYTRQQAIAFARARFWPLLGWSVLAGLLILVGLVLLLIPAIYLATVFGGALVGVVVIERAGIDRAFTLVNRRLFPVLGRMALLFLGALVYFLVITVITVPFGPVFGEVISNLLTVPLAVVGMVASVVTYAENRFHERHPVHTPVLADEIDRP